MREEFINGDTRFYVYDYYVAHPDDNNKIIETKFTDLDAALAHFNECESCKLYIIADNKCFVIKEKL